MRSVIKAQKIMGETEDEILSAHESTIILQYITSACVDVHMYMYILICYIHVHVYINRSYIYIYTCTCVCVYVCLY